MAAGRHFESVTESINQSQEINKYRKPIKSNRAPKFIKTACLFAC